MEVCTACGRELPSGSSACPSCGEELVAASLVVVQERRIVSVLFCDLVGFTEASENDDPEDVRARMEVYFRRVRHVIESFGGSVEKFIGDAVMAVFGVPVAHEDDATRAVRAGLAILEAIAELNAADPELRLSVRVGVNTGEVLASLGAAALGEGEVVGDAVNTAARIQSAAPVGAVAAGSVTVDASRGVIDWEPLDPIVAKGKSERVPVWRALGLGDSGTGDTGRSAAAPLVGRTRELALLDEAFDQVLTSKEPQLVTLMAEPGIGKSRLVSELLERVSHGPRPVLVRQGHCLAYGDGIAYWALGEAIKGHAGIYESDVPEVRAAKLEAVLPDERRSWLRACLQPLLGLEVDGSPGRREELFAAWRSFLISVAERTPLVLLIEDLHWAGAPMLAFLEHLVAGDERVPLLVICTSRPELEDTDAEWLARSGNPIHLPPLSDTDTARLVAARLDQKLLPAETQQLLLDRAGGNPLYAEEFIRMLRDRDLLDSHGRIAAADDVALPDSLQALIAARLDTLPRAHKALIQRAAVVGRVFWSGALSSPETGTEQVDELLAELVRREFVRQVDKSSIEGEAEYAFGHILVRDVAYAQLPRRERAALHIATSTWIERTLSDRLDDLAEVLAYHTTEALSLAEATRDTPLQEKMRPAAAGYLLLAGERVLRLDAANSFALLDQARSLTPEDDAAYPRLLLRWGDAALHSGRLPEAAAALAESADKSRARGDFTLAAPALTRLSTVRWRLAEAGMLEPVEEAVAMLEPSPGPELVKTLSTLANARIVLDEPELALAAAERALALAAELELPEHPGALGHRGAARVMLGDPDGIADIERAIEIFSADGALLYVATHMQNLATLRWLVEGTLAAVEQSERAARYALDHGFATLALGSATTEARARFCAGDLSRLLHDVPGLLERTRASGGLRHTALGLRTLTLAQIETGSDVTGSADELLRLAGESGDPVLARLCRWTAAAATLATGEADRALRLLEEPDDVDGNSSYLENPVDLPPAARTARDAGSAAVLARIGEGMPRTLPFQRHALATIEAVRAELSGDLMRAAELYGRAATGWEEFTATLEHAHALLDQGRCLVLAADSAALAPLQEARALFSRMGGVVGVRHCDELLGRDAQVAP